MADLFVSYARTDAEFVRGLHAALVERGKSVWVDWEDILPTADWLAAVEAGIEGSDAVVVVLTPDSLASEVCAHELAHAGRHNKRLVPVLRRQVDASAVPPALGRPNWVLLRDGDDRAAGVDTLVRALDTDLAWVQAHTRLLVRAIEWDAAGRDGSRLLRGGDLQEAERLVARPPGDPVPTALQREYLVAGREAAGRRQRLILGGVSTALVVAVALGLLALWQRNQAVTQRDTAQSRELTARSVARLPIDPQESVRLARDALARRATSESQEALSEALIRSRQLAALPAAEAGRLAGLDRGGDAVLTVGEDGRARVWRWRDDATAPALVLGADDGPVSAAALSPRGDLIATGGPEGTRIWEASSGRPLRTLPAGSPLEVAFSGDGRALLTLDGRGEAGRWATRSADASPAMAAGDAVHAALSDRGEVALTWGAGGAVAWEALTGRRLRGLEAGLVTAAGLSPDGAQAITGGADGTARVWTTRRPGRPLLLRGHQGQVTAARFSPDGGRLVTAGIDGTARVWSPVTGAPVRVLGGRAGPLVTAAFSGDGRQVVAAGDDGVARAWDARTGALRAEMAATGGNIVAAETSATGALVATQGYDGAVRIWDAGRGASRAELAGHRAPVVGVTFAPDGASVLTASFDGTARIWRGKQDATVLRTGSSAVQAAAFSPRGDRLITAGWDGRVRVWRAGGGPPTAVLRGHRGIVYAASFSPDGARAVTAGADGSARIWNVSSGRQLRLLRSPERRAIVAAEYDPAGDRIVTAGADRSARVWDAHTGRLLLDLEGHEDTVVAARFSPDGTRVVTASTDGTARVWDARQSAPETVLPVPPQAVDAAVSPDGTQVATAGQDGAVRVWTARTGRLQRILSGHTGPAVAVRFSPDGTMVASASEDGTARVWGARSGRRLETLAGAAAGLIAVAWSPDGRRLATGGIDGVARVYSCERCRAMEDPERVAEEAGAAG